MLRRIHYRRLHENIVNTQQKNRAFTYSPSIVGY